MAQGTQQQKENEKNEKNESGMQGQSQGLARTNDRRNRGLSRVDPFSSWSPMTVLNSFRNEMDRLFDDFGFGGTLAFPSAGSGFWSPQTEVLERDNKLIVRADLPGLTKDDIDVDIDDNRIAIRGERKNEHDETKEGLYRSERSYGSFFRSIPVPEGANTDEARASFNNGVLEITMPLPEKRESTARKLDIE
jgi:HSP20 family protein